MTAQPLACDTGLLHGTVRLLRGMAAEVEGTAVTALGASDPSWRGSAASEQRARRQEAAAGLRALAGPLEEVSLRLIEVATVAEDAGRRVRRHTAACQALDGERALLVAAGPAPEDALALREVRLAELEREHAWHRGLVRRAEGEYDELQRAVAARLERVHAELPALLARTGLLARAAWELRGAAGGAAGVVRMGATARRAMLLPGVVGERSRYRAALRVETALRRLRTGVPDVVGRVAVVGPALARAGARLLPVATAAEAAWTAADGGGHDGWRGGATRVLAVGAVAGVVVGAVGASPVVVAAGLGTVATYQAWMAGSWLYDNRQRIGGALARTWRDGRATAGRAAGRARSGLRRLRERFAPAPEVKVAGAGAAP